MDCCGGGLVAKKVGHCYTCATAHSSLPSSNSHHQQNSNSFIINPTPFLSLYVSLPALLISSTAKDWIIL